MRNKTLLTLLFVALSITLVYFIFAKGEVNNNEENSDKFVSKEMIKELANERAALKKKEIKLNKYKQNLESFESDLNKRYDDYLKKKKNLEKRELEFNKKLEDTQLDTKTIESYENIDPEQAALLMQEMYKNDPKLPPLIMRKISGKKAGKIIEALIELDTKTSAKLAKDVLDYFKSGKVK